MMIEPTPFFDEVAAQHPGLFDGEDEWQALIADPEHELVPVPDPSFSELLDRLMATVPNEVVAATWSSVDNERAWQGEEAGHGGDEDDRPAGDAEGADAERATVVVGDGEPGDVGEAGSEHAAPGGDSGSGAGGDGAD